MEAVWIPLKAASTFHVFGFFFFSLRVNSNLTWVYCAGDKISVHALFITVHNTIHTLKNIKNGSYGTIHIFKNYFFIVFSVFSFSNNKFNPNGPMVFIFSLLTLMIFFFFCGGGGGVGCGGLPLKIM